ncbi:hypothetical protein [Lacticaseibacillus mingshuiensis]|uniref:General secretion pathway protein K n=1 Tax=Lacticaseibacillus mingshuiensis TaxID=2799574 RepID=A0ABW4CKE9_9LACO|nr:hypothetical protein [Lacticaseibacillus mingshuiensis]
MRRRGSALIVAIAIFALMTLAGAALMAEMTQWRLSYQQRSQTLTVRLQSAWRAYWQADLSDGP